MGKPALAAVVLEAWEYSTFILSNSPRRVVRNPRRSARLDVENMIPDATSNELPKETVSGRAKFGRCKNRLLQSRKPLVQ
jgi:hypothetical protein